MKKYTPKPGFFAQNPILNSLVEPDFQGTNRIFVWVLKMMYKEQVIKDIISQM